MRKRILKLHLATAFTMKEKHYIAQFILEQQRMPTVQEYQQVLHLKKEKIYRYLHEVLSPTFRDKLRKNQKVPYITLVDAAYPLKLREIYQPPLVLFYQGEIALLQQPVLAVVGARKCSAYAQTCLKILLPEVIQKQIVTVSGLARGIDSLVHRITIGQKQRTIGVIGTGLDLFYPREHQSLQRKMMQEELVVSEYPLGSGPLKFHFPQRNRIIAGLCDTILLIEAKKVSGSLITASIALQENRNVLAVPGNITAELSQGCNELIAAGAKPVLRPQDILEEFGK
ncbi:DNA-processing protein DprA [Ligilactobacillus ceti]|nr:DNA-processing protein DprA [Ligilactobacillus ceti]